MKASMKKLTRLGLVGIIFAAGLLAGAIMFGSSEGPLAPDVVNATHPEKNPTIHVTSVQLQDDWTKTLLRADMIGYTITDINDLTFVLVVSNSANGDSGAGVAPRGTVTEVHNIPNPGPPNPPGPPSP